jgi:hypothetical protein
MYVLANAADWIRTLVVKQHFVVRRRGQLALAMVLEAAEKNQGLNLNK